MKELKIKIWNIENIVIMRVLDQDESLRGKGVIYKAKNGITIYSVNLPNITMDRVIHIRGKWEESDNNIGCFYFTDEDRAKEYVKKAKAAIEEYNNTIRDVLNGVEKQYLSRVISPFKDKVEYICKKELILTNQEYIEIKVGDEYTELPNFKRGTLFKGMTPEREYHIKELEL